LQLESAGPLKDPLNEGYYISKKILHDPRSEDTKQPQNVYSILGQIWIPEKNIPCNIMFVSVMVWNCISKSI